MLGFNLRRDCKSPVVSNQDSIPFSLIAREVEIPIRPLGISVNPLMLEMSRIVNGVSEILLLFYD